MHRGEYEGGDSVQDAMRRLAFTALASALLHCGSPSTNDATPPGGEGEAGGPDASVDEPRGNGAGARDAGARDAAPPADASAACGPREVTCATGCCPAGKTGHTIAAGLWFTCAIATGGTVKCTGWNVDGQGGRPNGSFESTVPVEVPGVTEIVALTAGNRHVCALSGTGAVTCWGANDFGQLGSGATGGKGPVIVAGLDPGVVAIAAGLRHTCAVTATRAVKCWGRNYEGTLGAGAVGDSLVPVDVGSLPSGGVAFVTTGGLSTSDFPSNPPSSPTCALSQTGALGCWGAYVENVPSLANGIADVSARGEDHRCVITGSGQVACWGFYNTFGQLGPATPDGVDSQVTKSVVAMPPGTDPVEIETGGRHSCVRTRAGRVKCWGYNSNGQLGQGGFVTNTSFSRTPVDAVGLDGVVEVAAGTRHTCARTAAGKVWCWGSRAYGALGIGSLQVSTTQPVEVPGF